MNCWSNLGTPDIKKVTSPKFICCPSKICNYIILYSVSKESPRWFPSSAMDLFWPPLAKEKVTGLDAVDQLKDAVKGLPGFSWSADEKMWLDGLDGPQEISLCELWLNALGEKLSIWIHLNCDGAGKPIGTPNHLGMAVAALPKLLSPCGWVWMFPGPLRERMRWPVAVDQKPSMGDQTPNETGSWRILRV